MSSFSNTSDNTLFQKDEMVLIVATKLKGQHGIVVGRCIEDSSRYTVRMLSSSSSDRTTFYNFKPKSLESFHEKRCSKCLQIVKYDFEKNKETMTTTTTLLPCCLHLFCSSCLPTTTTTSLLPMTTTCPVCNICQPTKEMILALPYVCDLQNPPSTLINFMLEEVQVTFQIRSLELQKRQETKQLQQLEMKNSKDVKDAKEKLKIVKDSLLSNKTKQQTKRILQTNDAYKEAKTLLERTEQMSKYKVDALKREQLLIRTTRLTEKTSLAQLTTERLPEIINQVNTAIDKHFRRASIKVHPDRYGTLYEKEFIALKEAKNALRVMEEEENTPLRIKYMEQLLEVACRIGMKSISLSHDSFVKKYIISSQEGSSNATNATTTTARSTRPLTLEGGLLYQQPRKPFVSQILPSHAIVILEMEPPNHNSTYFFFHYCIAIHIYGERCDLEGQEQVHLKTMSRDEVQVFANNGNSSSIRTRLELPSCGLWDLCWCCTMSGVGDNVDNDTTTTITTNTPKSQVLTVDVRTQKEIQRQENLDQFVLISKERLKQLRQAIEWVKKRGSSTTTTRLQDLQTNFFPAYIKARQTLYHLQKLIELVHYDNNESSSSSNTNNTVAQSLTEALNGAKPFMEQYEQLVKKQEEQNAFTNFKLTVFEMLEMGTFASWLRIVSKDELEGPMCGNANRLYQLLIEGKKAHSIQLVDVETLDAAITRDDLFTSTKQMDMLKKRRDEVQELATKEAQVEVERQAKLEREEAERKSMQERASYMERGTTVVLQHLVNQSNLNGQLATYMGVAPSNDRYILKLYGKEPRREVSLKKENFIKWDGKQLAPVVVATTATKKEMSWQCRVCTFLHEGEDLAKLPECTMCGSKRQGKVYQMDAATVAEQKQEEENRRKEEQANRLAQQKLQQQQQQDQQRLKNEQRKAAEAARQRVKEFDEAAAKQQQQQQQKQHQQQQQKQQQRQALPAATASPKNTTKTTATTTTPSSDTTAPSATAGTMPDALSSSSLFRFLKKQRQSLKRSPRKFCEWLHSEDVETIEDLEDACDDEDFSKQLVIHGLKKFKTKAFYNAVKKAAAAEAAERKYNDDDEENGGDGTSTISAKVSPTAVAAVPRYIPDELVCPITHVIFNDPVVARDGGTYERVAITEWFVRQQQQIVEAYDELVVSPASQRARDVIARGVIAPSGVRVDDFTLVDNRNTKIMARNFLERNPWAQDI